MNIKCVRNIMRNKKTKQKRKDQMRRTESKNKKNVKNSGSSIVSVETLPSTSKENRPTKNTCTLNDTYTRTINSVNFSVDDEFLFFRVLYFVSLFFFCFFLEKLRNKKTKSGKNKKDRLLLILLYGKRFLSFFFLYFSIVFPLFHYDNVAFN